MSRVGKKPVSLPAGVAIRVEGDNVLVKGPKGELSLRIPDGIGVETMNGQVIVKLVGERVEKSRHGLMRSLIANAVQGVTQGFEKRLCIIGIGYRADMEGANLRLSLGFSHPVHFPAPPGIQFAVETLTPVQLRLASPVEEGTTGSNISVVIIRGIDRQLVGETAARIRALRPPEPYKGKGVRYEREIVRRKAGKAGV